MTILRVGSVDKISEENMKEVNSLISKDIESMTVPELKIGPAWDWSGSVCLKITPVVELNKLYEIVIAACEAVLRDKAPKPKKKFIPHITLAYPRDSDVSCIQDQLDKDSPATTASLNELSLVKQRQTIPYYQWDVVDRINLN